MPVPSTGPVMTLQPPQLSGQHAQLQARLFPHFPTSLRPEEAIAVSDMRDDREEDDEDKIKRPMNAFMVWAQKRRKELAEEYPKMHNSEISKRLGKEWKEMSNAAKEPFQKKSKELREEHMKKYPDYKYKPKKKKTRVPTDLQKWPPLPSQRMFGSSIFPSAPNQVMNTYDISSAARYSSQFTACSPHNGTSFGGYVGAPPPPWDWNTGTQAQTTLPPYNGCGSLWPSPRQTVISSAPSVTGCSDFATGNFYRTPPAVSSYPPPLTMSPSPATGPYTLPSMYNLPPLPNHLPPTSTCHDNHINGLCMDQMINEGSPSMMSSASSNADESDYDLLNILKTEDNDNGYSVPLNKTAQQAGPLTLPPCPHN